MARVMKSGSVQPLNFAPNPNLTDKARTVLMTSSEGTLETPSQRSIMISPASTNPLTVLNGGADLLDSLGMTKRARLTSFTTTAVSSERNRESEGASTESVTDTVMADDKVASPSSALESETLCLCLFFNKDKSGSGSTDALTSTPLSPIPDPEVADLSVLTVTASSPNEELAPANISRASMPLLLLSLSLLPDALVLSRDGETASRCSRAAALSALAPLSTSLFCPCLSLSS